MQDPNKLLKSAVDEIVHLINDEKLAPHAAVVKTAKEQDLNVHFIKRACEVINVALTYEHFRKHASERDADFPIVDAQAVSAEIFPETESTAAEKRSNQFSGTMVEEEVPNFLKARTNAKFKQAFVDLKSQVEPERVMSDQGIAEKAGYARQNLFQELDNCRTEAFAVKMALASSFSKLTNHWSKEASARTSFTEFESQVFSRYGEAAVPYLDLMHKAAGSKEARGEHDAKNIAFDDAPETVSFGELMKAASVVPIVNEKVANITAAIAEMENKRAHAYRTLGEARLQQLHADDEPEVKQATEAAPSIFEEEPDPVLVAANRKVAATAKEAAGAPGAGFLFDAFVDQYKKEATPSAGGNGEMNNLNRKLLIQNLMTTDPILKTYEPKRVADSYEQFLRLAPELSNEKEIVRSHLRQMAASQAMTAFDGAQLMDANTKLVKQRQLESGAKPMKEDK